jgi:hypothetical protein
MHETTAGAETPAGGEVAPTDAIPVETSEATTEQSVTDNTAEQAEPDIGADTPAQPKKKHWAHDRIDELTRARREAERQAEYWKAKASQTTDPDSLDYEEGIAERTIQRTRQEQAETARDSAASLAQEAFSYRETIAREKFSDYDAVARNPGIRITEEMAEVIRDLDSGPEIAYHLGKNPAEAARIAALSPHRQAVELGKLEVIVTSPKPIPKQPPAPVQPVSGIAAGGSKDPGKMSPAEYIAWRKANP